MKKVYSATITPLLADGSLDTEGLRNIIERNIRHGMDGIFILGTMGEWGSFDDEFQYDYVKKTCEIANGRLEVLVGVLAPSLPVSLKKMDRYKNLQFKSYVFMPPGGRSSALDPLKSVMDFLDVADRPSCFYYCPANNNIVFSMQQLTTILSHPNLYALKDSSSNMQVRRELLWRRKELGISAMLLEGQEWSCDEAMLLGYDGILCGFGALCSKLMVGMARAIDRNDFNTAQELQNTYIDICHGIYGRNMETSRAGQKYALTYMNIINSPLSLAHDMSCLTAEAKQRIEQCVDKYRSILN